MDKQREACVKVVILMGPPGSGKGTQVHLLAKALSIPFLGMGDLLREESTKNTPRGCLVRSFIDAGEIAPWSLTGELFKDRLQATDSPLIILDGIPRNMEQAYQVEKILEEIHAHIICVVFLDVPEKDLIQRIQNRYLCLDCGISCSYTDTSEFRPCSSCGGINYTRRQDDEKSEILKRRLEVYREMTESLVDYYRNLSLLLPIDGTLSIDSIQKIIISYIQDVTRDSIEKNFIDID